MSDFSLIGYREAFMLLAFHFTKESPQKLKGENKKKLAICGKAYRHPRRPKFNLECSFL